MAEPRFVRETSRDSSDSLTRQEREVLERAVAKIIGLGEQVGVSTDEMITLLQSGLTVRELLEYLMSRTGDVA